MSIIQSWAGNLGLRHQGVLVSAVRGCDTVQRNDKSKWLVRMYRGVILVPHCGDIQKAASFMMPFDESAWYNTAADFLRDLDHYPLHWVMHWMHAVAIVGYKHPDDSVRAAFNELHLKLAHKFHVIAESESQIDARLNADEKTFLREQS